jgi:hypothetical protein
MPFGKVLVLHKGLALPVGDMEGSENVLNMCASFNGGVVADETAESTAGTYAVLKGIRKLLLDLHTVDIADKGGGAAEELSRSGAIIHSWGVGAEGVRKDVLIALGCIDSRIVGLEPFLESIVHGNARAGWWPERCP